MLEVSLHNLIITGGKHMENTEKLIIKRRDTRKNKQTTVHMRVNIDTYQKIEKAANEANFSMIEMLDTLIAYAVDNLEIKK